MVGKINFQRFLPIPSGGFWKKANPWKIHVNLRMYIYIYFLISSHPRQVQHEFPFRELNIFSDIRYFSSRRCESQAGSPVIFSICSRKYNIHSCTSPFISLSSQPCWFVEGYDCLVVHITYYYVLDCFGMYYSMPYRTINL